MRGGRPALVLRPRDAREVAEAVVFAGSRPAALPVRSGGHGFSGR
ncbi:FAD-dependent oxidoreductase [Streptomyces canarius]|nr:FAD-dependent oxidoreductase [Streptomyces canarius]